MIILTTGWTLADPIASVLIALLILPRTWSLLREAIDVLLQAAPKGVDLDEVRAHLLRGKGIVDDARPPCLDPDFGDAFGVGLCLLLEVHGEGQVAGS